MLACSFLGSRFVPDAKCAALVGAAHAIEAQRGRRVPVRVLAQYLGIIFSNLSRSRYLQRFGSPVFRCMRGVAWDGSALVSPTAADLTTPLSGMI